MELKDQIRLVVEKHIPSIREGFIALESALYPNADVYTAHQAAHKLKGSAGSIGFDQVSIAAQRIEAELRSISAEKIENVPEDMMRDLELLRVLVAEISPEKSKLLEKYVDNK